MYIISECWLIARPGWLVCMIMQVLSHGVPFFFFVDPILHNTDKQSQLFGQAPGKSYSDSLKTKTF